MISLTRFNLSQLNLFNPINNPKGIISLENDTFIIKLIYLHRLLFQTRSRVGNTTLGPLHKL